MSPEGVAFLVVLAAVGAIPGVAALVSYRVHVHRLEGRMIEIVGLLRARHPQPKRAIGYRTERDDEGPKSGRSIVHVPTPGGDIIGS